MSSHDIAKVDARAILDASLPGSIGFGFRDRSLYPHSTIKRIDNATELHEQAIADGLDDASALLVKNRINQFPPMRPLAGDSSGLVGLHVARIADHIDRQNGGEPACHAVGSQNCSPFRAHGESYDPSRVKST